MERRSSLCTLCFSDGDGRITGSDATKFFSMSNLSRQDLKQVFYFLLYDCLVGDEEKSERAMQSDKTEMIMWFLQVGHCFGFYICYICSNCNAFVFISYNI